MEEIIILKKKSNLTFFRLPEIRLVSYVELKASFTWE